MNIARFLAQILLVLPLFSVGLGFLPVTIPAVATSDDDPESTVSDFSFRDSVTKRVNSDYGTGNFAVADIPPVFQFRQITQVFSSKLFFIPTTLLLHTPILIQARAPPVQVILLFRV